MAIVGAVASSNAVLKHADLNGICGDPRGRSEPLLLAATYKTDLGAEFESFKATQVITDSL
jgi:hypothetical protein